MPETGQEIILDITLKYEDAIKGIVDFTNKIEDNKNKIKDLKKEQADLSAEIKKSGDTTGELSTKLNGVNQSIAATTVEMATNRKSVNALSSEIQNNIKVQNMQVGSINALKAQLSMLTKEWYNLTVAQQQGEQGKALAGSINEIRSQVQASEEGIGNFTRNVGNYQNAILNTIGAHSEFGKGLIAMASAAQSGTPILSQLSNKVKEFTAAIKENPIIAIIAAVIISLEALKKALNIVGDAIKDNEDAADRYEEAMSPMTIANNMYQDSLQKIATWASKASLSVTQFLLNARRGLEGMGFGGEAYKKENDELERVMKLQRDKAAFDEKGRQLTVDNAKAQMDATKLLAESRDKEHFMAEQRLDMLKQANNIEQTIADNNVNRAKEQLRIFEQENLNRIKAGTLSKQKLEEQANLQAAVFNADTARFEKMQGLLRRENQTKQEIANDDKKRIDDAKKVADDREKDLKEQYDKENAAVRKQQDIALSMLNDGIAKQRKQLQLNADREVDDLLHKLNTEKNLTDEAREAMVNSIKLIADKLKIDLGKLSDEEIKEQIDKEQKRIQLVLDGVSKEGEQAHAIRLQQIEENRKAELQANKMLTEEKRQDESLINQKYDNQRTDENVKRDQQVYKNSMALLDNEMASRISAVGKGSIAEYEIRMQYAKKQYDDLINIDDDLKIELFASQAEYEKAVLDSYMKMRDASKQTADSQKQIAKMQRDVVVSLSGAFSDMLTTIAKNNASMAAFAKAMAIFNIGISTGEAIAQALTMKGPGDLLMPLPLRIAAAIAAVLAGISKAYEAVNQGEPPKPPTFAAGGLISGAGSGTSDSIPIMASNGESVLTAAATSMFAPLASVMNQIGGGVPIGYANMSVQNGQSQLGEDMLARAVAKGYMLAANNMPAPIVSVEEIQRVTARVQVLERLSQTR